MNAGTAAGSYPIDVWGLVITVALVAVAAGMSYLMTLTDASDIDRANAWFARYGSLAVLVGRVIPIVRSLVSIPAGLARTNLAGFALLTTVGSAVWNTILVVAGYLLGAQWCGILGFLDRFQLVAAAVIVALVAWYVVAKVRAARHASLS